MYTGLQKHYPKPPVRLLKGYLNYRIDGQHEVARLIPYDFKYLPRGGHWKVYCADKALNDKVAVILTKLQITKLLKQQTIINRGPSIYNGRLVTSEITFTKN